MNRIAQDKFALRHEVVRYAETHGLRAAARRYECSRTTVRLWFHRWKDGDDALADHSRRPHHSPKRTSEAVAAKVIAAREKAPCFGARRLVDMFDLPVGKGAAHRILRDEKLIRPRPRKHQRKADLRAIKAAQPPLLRLQMDTKYLNDIPHYFPQMQQPGMPRFQYTIRCEALGALFLTYSCELSKTYATLTLQRVLAHLAAHGLDLTQLVVRTDLGTEFDGDTVHYRDDGFHGALTSVGATHRFNPPAHPNANADVESSHATIEPEFFDLESFRDPAHFLAAATTYQHFFNFARKNRSRGDFTPADLLATRAPHLSPKILLLPPILLDAHVGQDLSGAPAVWRFCPRRKRLAIKGARCSVSRAHEQPPLAVSPIARHVSRPDGSAEFYVHRDSWRCGDGSGRHGAGGDRGHYGDPRRPPSDPDESRAPARPQRDDVAGARSVWRE